jgi:glycine cleavage system aminomethyltransferase T
VNWKLMGLVVESEVPPPPGEKLVREGKEIGEVTSSCVSPTLAKTIALAYLRREVVEPGTKLAFPSGTVAKVVPLPFYQRPPMPRAA